MMATKLCPRDGHALKETIYEHEKIKHCDLCSGTWLSIQSYMNILSRREIKFTDQHAKDLLDYEAIPKIELDVDPKRLLLACPECRKPMTQEKFSPKYELMLDKCELGHGIWLDGTELERVQILFEKG